jgi:pimeloyl-ACP methyl ester carboxylesterase
VIHAGGEDDDADVDERSEMSSYVLIHGSWHGAWTWSRVAPHLERAGHEVTAIDLPGCGDDRTPRSQVSLASYADAALSAVRRCGEPPILVGHSMGGATITLAGAADVALRAVVYVAAFLPPSGRSVVEVARQDEGSLVASAIRPSPDGSAFLIDRETAVRALYGDCDPESIAWALARLGPDPSRPGNEPVVYDRAALERRRLFYVECDRDRAISPPAQRRMQSNVRVEAVFALSSDHSPQISHPVELAAVLLEVAQRTA